MNTDRQTISNLLAENNRKNISVVGKIDSVLYPLYILNNVVLDGYKHYYTKDISGECLIIQNNMCFDNIHLYYEFMSDEGRRAYADIINNVFQSRINSLLRPLNIERYMLNDLEVASVKMLTSIHVTSLSLFGIEDTMMSLDLYKAKIKASDNYKKYLETKIGAA